MLKRPIVAFIDFFYWPFAWLLPLKTFRYGFTGAGNACLNLLIFYLCNHYIYADKFLCLGTILIPHYIAADLTALCVSFPVGFLLNKYIVFDQSVVRSSRQLFYYGALTITTVLLHYVLLQIFVGYFHLWATPSEALIIVLLAGISYWFQTSVTFR